MKNKQFVSSLLLLLTALIWGVAFVAQSVSMDYIEPFTFNCIRSIIGGIVLLPVIALFSGRKNAEDTPSDPKTAAKAHRTLIIGGICCGAALCIASNLQQFGIQHTTVGKAGFITAMYIIIVPIMGLALKKHPPFTVWISVIIGVAGMYLLCMSGSFSVSKGDLLVMLCAVMFSVHILVIDRFSPYVNGVKLSCIQFFVCGILSGICMLIFEHPSVTAILSAWIPLLYAGIMSCGVAYTLQIIGQKNMDPTVASLILSLESVFSVIAGFIILHQKMTVRELIGCAIMFAAIILAQLPSKKIKS